MIAMRIQVKSTRKRRPAAILAKQYKKDVQNILRKVGAVGVNNVRSEIKKRHLVQTGDMLRSVNYKMTPKGVRFSIDSPAGYLNTGIRRHKMKYLLKSDSPIPVDAANQIFRWATPKALASGSFVHPGFKRGKGFVKVAIKRTRESLSKELKTIAGKVF